ncbi:unnamed protein product [Paramecium primaurelia]|uniref:Tetratricopeptide repeat protein n=1 Tax=Paramecium primaurelia TaxID=5886 RepID=A0A8S1PY65_PARPR|nr:unnamed protein product [Paramecium primaurelia]
MNQFFCQYEWHLGEKIIGYCINSQCKNKSSYCYFCLQHYHRGHQNDCIDINTINQIIQQQINDRKDFIQKIQNKFSQIEKIIQTIKNQSDLEIDNLIKMETFLKTNAHNDFRNNIHIIKQCHNSNQQIKDWEFLHNLDLVEQTIKNASNNREKHYQQLDVNIIIAKRFYKNGQSLSNKNQYHNALEQFNQATLFDPNNDEYHLAKSNQLLNLQQYEQAIQCCQDTIKLNPQSYLAHCNSGFALNRMNSQEQARIFLEKAIQINPKEVQAYIIKGEMLFNQQSYKEALQCFETVIRISPNAYPAYKFQANILNKLKKFTEAFNVSLKALQINVNDLEAYLLLTFALNQLKDFERTIQYCDDAIQNQLKSEILYNNKGYALLNLKQYGKAIENFDQALLINPNYALSISNKGDALSGLKQYQQALLNYQKAYQISKDPNHLVKQLQLKLQIQQREQQQ